MATITLHHIATPYALKEIDLTIHNGEFMVVLGHSGAGKSTLLNILAGFVQHSGDLFFDEICMNHMATEKRAIGYLHQDIHLFPHLNVFENIAFGLRVKGLRQDVIMQKVSEMTQMLHIAHLEERYPKNLSGGEKQRVGIARSIITQPAILLLDEPLSSLDELTAQGIREELKALQKALQLSVVYVTHNKLDALFLADRVVILKQGRIEAIGTPQAILNP